MSIFWRKNTVDAYVRKVADIMILEEAIRERIYELAQVNNITINKVATLAGIPHTTLLAFMNRDTKDPRISTLLHICEAFNITLKDFFDSPIFQNVIRE